MRTLSQETATRARSLVGSTGQGAWPRTGAPTAQHFAAASAAAPGRPPRAARPNPPSGPAAANHPVPRSAAAAGSPRRPPSGQSQLHGSYVTKRLQAVQALCSWKPTCGCNTLTVL